MIEKNINGLTASQLRIALMASIFVITAVTAVGFYFIQDKLTQYAIEVSHATEDAKTSDNDVRILKSLETQLIKNEANIMRTKSIVSNSESYAYQSSIIDELTRFAERSRVTISGFEFSAVSSTTPAAASTPETAAPLTSIPGVKSTSVAVSLVAPTKYKDLLDFIHNIEQSLTKMQLASISLTKGTGPDEVTTSTLLIEVYIR